MEEGLNPSKGCQSKLRTPLLYDLLRGEQLMDQHGSLVDCPVIHTKICLLSEILDTFSRSLSAGPFLNDMGVEENTPRPHSSILLPWLTPRQQGSAPSPVPSGA